MQKVEEGLVLLILSCDQERKRERKKEEGRQAGREKEKKKEEERKQERKKGKENSSMLTSGTKSKRVSL